jgi:type II secretory pathway pseudopilin PulG
MRNRRAGGYTLVILVVAIAVLGILLAAALPSWSGAIRRERERELIFRGMQYAEAIRVFQERNGRLPISLDELIQTRPRSIRKLWKDPMTKDGRWQLVVTPTEAPIQPGQNSPPVGIRRTPSAAESNGQNSPSATGSTAVDQPATGRGSGLAGTGGVVAGPIRGVFSNSDKKSLMSFMGQNNYRAWLFTVDIVPVPTVRPETAAITRARGDWVGKAFPEGVTPQQGNAPSAQTEREKSGAGN